MSECSTKVPVPRRVTVLASYGPSLVILRGPLLQAMAGRGHSVLALAPNLAKETVDTLTSWGVRVQPWFLRRTGTNPVADLCSLLALSQRLRRASPEVVLAYTWKPVVYGGLVAQWAGIPRFCPLITGLGSVLAESAPHFFATRSILVWLLRRALRRPHCVFFQNQDDRDDLNRLEVLPKGAPVRVVRGSGVDLEHFTPVPPVTVPPVFLLVARLLREKGVLEFCQAAASVRAQFPACRFQLAGLYDEHPRALRPADLEPWLRAGHVEYLGILRDVRPALAAASVCVLPSYREGMPRCLLEGMAMARPLITTTVAGCRETVVEGSNGFLVAPRDAGMLAAAMLRFVADPALIPVMGARSRELACERFDVREVNRAMLEGMGL